jgi:hypothetical protein
MTAATHVIHMNCAPMRLPVAAYSHSDGVIPFAHSELLTTILSREVEVHK